MCVSAPQPIKIIHMKKDCIANQQSNKSYCLQFLYMAFAIDTIDGRGLSNEARCELLPKKSKVMLYLPFISQ